MPPMSARTPLVVCLGLASCFNGADVADGGAGGSSSSAATQASGTAEPPTDGDGGADGDGLGGGESEPSEQNAGTYQCKAPGGAGDVGWTTIRNAPDAFVIGNCKDGWTLKRAKKSDANGFTWSGGRIWGHFNADGWVRSDSLTWVNSNDNNFTNASTHPSKFGSLFNCVYGEDGSFGDCTGGNDYMLRNACPAFANPGGQDPVGDLQPGTAIQWRFNTLDGAYTMVKVNARSCAHGPGENHALGWVFVPSGCIEHPPRRVLDDAVFDAKKHCIYDGANNNTGICAAEGSRGTLVRGQNLIRAGGPQGEMRSPNKAALLSHQGDGNLVLYRVSDMAALWSTNTAGQATTHAVQQEDGNFVLYNGSAPVWSAGTVGQTGAWLEVQDDCNLVIYSAGGAAVWTTATSCGGVDPTGGDPTGDPPLPDCYARCCDETLHNVPSADAAACVDAAQAVCNDHRHVKRAEWNGSVEAYSRPMGCWAKCGGEAEYHDLEGVNSGCADKAATFCGNKGGLQDACWHRCQPVVGQTCVNEQ